MRVFRLFFVVMLLFLPLSGFCDIIITTDGMILNGKIIEEAEGEYVKLGNYHGIFTVDYKLIKEIHRTGAYQEDMEIFNKLGKTVDEGEIKTNYEAGIKKLDEHKKGKIKIEKRPIHYLVCIAPFFNINLGDLHSVLPCSFGVSIFGDVRFPGKSQIIHSGIRLDLQYFHAEKNIKRISAVRFALGPLLNFPLKVNDFSFNMVLVPALGTGYYMVRGRNEEAADFKLNMSITAGPEFFISGWVLSPHLRFDYIHDGTASLYGVGIAMGAGYLF